MKKSAEKQGFIDSVNVSIDVIFMFPNQRFGDVC